MFNEDFFDTDICMIEYKNTEFMTNQG